MKLAIREHSQSTKVSDLLLAVFSVAYFVFGFCITDDLFACFIFLLCVLCIILIKYLHLSKNEEE